MQFSELICKSDIDMDNLGTNLDQFLLVPSIAEISPRILKIINSTRFAIYFDTLGSQMYNFRIPLHLHMCA